MRLTIDASALKRLEAGLKELSSAGRDKVMVRVLNRVGDTVYSNREYGGGVVQRLSAVTGMQQKRVRRVVTKKRAYSAGQDFVIRGRDGHTSLKDFRSRRQKRGVSAAPWKKRRIFPGTFIGPGGHTFKRVGKARNAIKRLWGPALPVEMLRGETPALVQQVTATEYPKRVAHEIDYELGRIKKKHDL